MTRRYEVVVYEIDSWPNDPKSREWRSRFVGGVLITADRELGMLEAVELAAAADVDGELHADPHRGSS